MKKTLFRQWTEKAGLGYFAAAGVLGSALVVNVMPGEQTTAVPSTQPQETIAQALIRTAVAEKEPAPVELADAAVQEAEWDLPNLDHPRVDYWIERFTTDKRDDFANFLARKGLYEDMISRELAERDMPQDLIYLAMIESGFQAKAYSSADASGIWQFIPDTGRRYGLEINRAVDERNDPEKATEAALSYLSDLHDRFGSWYLSAAAYNTGENRVGRIMRQVTGSERGDDENYYTIWDRLPAETRDYVPLMMAAARISKNPEKYGFEDVKPLEPVTFDRFLAEAATPLVQVAKATGSTVDEILELNPELKLKRTRNDEPSTLRVPSR